MPAHNAESKPRAAKKRVAKAAAEQLPWFGPKPAPKALEAFGFRLKGGGAHQSKTMMLAELRAVLASSERSPSALRDAIIIDNVLGKATASTRALNLRHLASLYGLNKQPPLTRLLFGLWDTSPNSRPLVALLVALARDPLLRDTARVVVDGPVGEAIQRPLFEASLSAHHPGRFSDAMLRSLAQNCASTWTQSGHLRGAMRKQRQRIVATPEVVALAALIATVAGFGGPAILSSPWMSVLDISPGQALDLLRRAESLGLARVRSVGDVTEIATVKPFAATLRVHDLEYAR